MDMPLKGIKVLDLSRVLTGPYCTMILADFGAEVIKVERPGSGDDTRKWGPPFVKGESAYYLSVNRNKKSITIDLKTDKGKEILKKMVREADVLVENFRPGTMERLQLDYNRLKRINPQLIYCAISGFGQDGPYHLKPGYDVMIQGMGGLMGITGEEGRPPVRVGVAIVDIGAGMWAAMGIMAALRVKESTGKGQFIDVALMDGLVAWMTFMAGNYFLTGSDPKRCGSAHPNVAPYQAFATADNYIIVAIGNDSLWKKLCLVLELEELIDDDRFSTNMQRVLNKDELVSVLAKKFKEKSSQAWLVLLDATGIPAGPINKMSDVFADPQVLHREMSVEVPHPTIGSVKMTGIPVKFSKTPGQIRSAPPLLGEHTIEILEQMGYDRQDIISFKEQQVI